MELALLIVGAYLLAGVPAGVLFVLLGARRLDANPMTWGARILLLPGCVALWPVLWLMALRSKAAAA